MIDETKTAAAPVTEPHPLAPLQDHLSGSTHNAGGAVKAIEAFVSKEIAKLRAEFAPKEEEK